MTVTYRMVLTGNSEHEVGERLITKACPSCGADWTVKGVALPRGPSRSFLCTACMEIHDAQLVDERGRAVASPGWGLAQQQRGEHGAGGHAAR